MDILRQYVQLIVESLRPYDILQPAQLPYGNDKDGLRKHVARPGKATLVWRGMLPLSDFFDLKHGNVKTKNEEEMEALKGAIRTKEVWGGEEPHPAQYVFIYIEPGKEPYIGEGNHRIWALKEMHESEEISSEYMVPVELRYIFNTDLEPDAWKPKSLA